MKYNFAIILLFFLTSINAQDEILRISNDLKTSPIEIEDTFTIINKTNNDIALFLKDDKNTYGYLFDEDFKQKSSLKSENLTRKYKDFLGSSVFNDSYNLFISNNKHTAFGIISYSFADKKTTLKEIDLKFSKESFLQSISHNNNFYLLTATKNGLNLYSFNKDGNYNKTVFDFSDKKFLSTKNTLCDFNFSLGNIISIPKNIDVQKIKSSNPNSIEVTSERIKLYIENNSLILTIDNTTGFTQVIKIHLLELTSEIVNIKKPYIYAENEFIKSNSFIYGDKILQIIATRKELAFTVKDLETKKIIKEYNLKSTDSITFKNTPIIQDRNKSKFDTGINIFSSNHREFEKTTKFLRKITAQRIGISAFKIDGINQITIGGIIEVNSGVSPLGMPGSGSFPIGNFGAVNATFNTSLFAYNMYSSSISISIDCLFDNNFEHIKGDIKENVFDKITNFKDEKEKFIKAETLFHHKDQLYFGSCLGNSKTYLIMKFSN